MADGKNINKKISEILTSDTAINSVVDGRVWYGDGHPVGNSYPQIIVQFQPGESEEVYPAMSGVLDIYIWGEKTRVETGVVAQVKGLMEKIHLLINRNDDEPLTEVDVTENEGLRVVQCNRLSAIDGEHKETGRYFGEMNYRITMSDNEDFTSDGGFEWVE